MGLSADQLAQYERDGYLVLKGFFEKKVVEVRSRQQPHNVV